MISRLSLSTAVILLCGHVSWVVLAPQTAEKIYYSKRVQNEPFLITPAAFSQCMTTCTRIYRCTAIAFLYASITCLLYEGQDLTRMNDPSSLVVYKSDFTLSYNDFCTSEDCQGALECGPIPVVAEATVYGDQRYIGARVLYACDVTNQHIHVTCLAGGHWSDDTPSCAASASSTNTAASTTATTSISDGNEIVLDSSPSTQGNGSYIVTGKCSFRLDSTPDNYGIGKLRVLLTLNVQAIITGNWPFKGVTSTLSLTANLTNTGKVDTRQDYSWTFKLTYQSSSDAPPSGTCKIVHVTAGP